VSVGCQKRCGVKNRKNGGGHDRYRLNMWEAKKLHALERIRQEKMSVSHKSTGQERRRL